MVGVYHMCKVTCDCLFAHSGGFSYTLWDKWEIRGHSEFKLSDFMEKVKVVLS